MWKRALLAPLVIGALALTASNAHADPPISDGGLLLYGRPVLVGTTTVGQTTFIDVDIDGETTGLLNGTIDEQYTVVHHAQAGFNTYRGVLEFEGVVTDAAGVDHHGTLSLLTRGRQDPGMPFPTPTPWYMSWVIVGGDGQLEHVHGHGTGVIILDPDLGFVLDYGGRVHFSGH